MKVISQIPEFFSIWLNNYNNKKIITLTPEKKNGKSVLISYLTAPFLTKNQIFNHTHTNFIECRTIVDYFLKKGFIIDVINWDNNEFVPYRKYDVIVDIHSNIDRLSNHFQQDSIKILYATGSHWLTQNIAEYQRIYDLQLRSGISLIPRRQTPPCQSAEKADYIIVLGKKSAYNSFLYSRKPIYSINLFSLFTREWDDNKNYDHARNNYLWLGTSGLVHKGLDVILESFIKIPNKHLYICGDISSEPDFQKFYYNELYKTPNIHTVGWIDIYSIQFTEIIQKCIGLIYPSCSEGQSGSVITCMNGGLIPIISEYCGIEVQDNGFIIEDISADEIIRVISRINSISSEELKKMARKAWESVNNEHTLEKYKESINSIFDSILDNNYSINKT